MSTKPAMIAVLFAAFWLALLPVQAAPQEGDTSAAIPGIKEALQTMPVVRAQFTQSRHMAVLSRPLSSQGSLIFTKEEGIAWLIEKPYPVNLVLTSTHVSEWEEGEDKERVPLSARPALSSLVSILVPVLSGDLAALEDRFEMETALVEDGWQVVLTPRGDALAGVVETIRLSGDDRLRGLTVKEAGGDETEIRFSKYRPEPSELTAEERRYFEE